MRERYNQRETLRPLASLLAQTLERSGLGRVVLLSRLHQYWAEIVGPQLAKVAQPEGVRSGVLFIVVADAIWLQQLKFYQSQLLKNLRKVLGDVPIQRLHCTLATPVRAARPSAVKRPQKVVPPPLPLTTEEERQVLAGTDNIADPELRELVRRTWRIDWQSRGQK